MEEMVNYIHTLRSSFDKTSDGTGIVLAVLVLIKAPEISNVALGVAIVLLAFHQIRAWIGKSRNVPQNE